MLDSLFLVVALFVVLPVMQLLAIGGDGADGRMYCCRNCLKGATSIEPK